MSMRQYPATLEAQLPDGVIRRTQDISLARTAAAGSLVASACLLLAGRRGAALLAGLAGGGLMALDNPEAAKELWNRLPAYLRQTEDMIERLQDTVAQVQVQAEKLRETFARR